MAIPTRTIGLAKPRRQPESKVIIKHQQQQPQPPPQPQQQLAKPKRSGRIHNSSSSSRVSGILLPADAQELKDKIIATHPEKLTRFSLSHMKRVAIPPVEIPKKLDGKSVVTTVVSGKDVPLTRRMWENCKKRAHHLDMIDEYVVYR